jgi:hypothetical protein
MTIDLVYYRRAAHEVLDRDGRNANILLRATTLLALLDQLASVEAHRDVLMDQGESIARERDALRRAIQAGLR